jgi:hypothetical protein
VYVVVAGGTVHTPCVASGPYIRPVRAAVLSGPAAVAGENRNSPDRWSDSPIAQRSFAWYGGAHVSMPSAFEPATTAVVATISPFAGSSMIVPCVAITWIEYVPGRTAGIVKAPRASACAQNM